ncbi:MAG: A/G-specific adenine glycosylase [Megasphaera sp.]|nr:A/G-specific adenine glycosylase [Megasphaera sp.]
MKQKHFDNKIWYPILLNWFSTHRRALPWRENRTPYKVWVSEIMLQQTKVEAVRPYYDSWMERFPDIKSLAAASQDEVLRQWQGLGYYSRARNLHEAVCEVQSQYKGIVPDNKADILKLKGIGEYTAGAILSIAYGKPEAAVDGNVLRIFSRLYDIEENILSAAVKKKITGMVQEQLPPDTPGDFNEALMDLGASICIPKHPRCQVCPLISFCLAKAKGTEEHIPIRRVKKNIPIEEILAVVIEQNDSWLLHRRPDAGLLASMWEFPNVEGKGEEGRRKLQDVLADVGCRIDFEDTPQGTLRHVFSHKIWHMTVLKGHLVSGNLNTKEEWQWLPKDRYTEIPWAGPHGKITAWQ